MKCPHCLVEVNESFNEDYLGEDREGHWSTFTMKCPNLACGKFIVDLAKGTGKQGTGTSRIVGVGSIKKRSTIKPIMGYCPNAPVEVDKKFADDYNEACLVLAFSPKASAALSRRCLQNILREKAGVKKSDLYNEIEEVIKSGHLPSYLAENLDAIRVIGNFAAHPMKSTSTGEIVEVEFLT